MNKKGFTLIEILGVIIIIISLGLLVIPNIINRFSNKKEDIDKVDKELIVSAAKLYLDESSEDLSGYKTYCLDINKLIEKGYLTDIKNNSDNNYVDGYKVKFNPRKNSDYDVVKENECENKSVYSTGTKIKVAGIDFYIISEHDDYVVALKDDVLTVDELNESKIGSDGVNHVNKGLYSPGEVRNGTYGGLIAYYSSDQCNDGYNVHYSPYCNDFGEYDNKDKYYRYGNSDVRYIIDKYVDLTFKNNELKEVDGYKARLITSEDLRNDLGCLECSCANTSYRWIYMPNVYSSYWKLETANVWGVNTVNGDGTFDNGYYNMYYALYVRPVVNVYKSAIQIVDE